MPIQIPDSLPARATLEEENIFVMTEFRAIHQDIRPLNLLILNLMPTKIVTETQLLRKLSNSPLQVQVELLRTLSHVSHNTDEGHLESFYTSFDAIKHKKYDGMIITGAPVENLEFEEVDYWEELCQIMDWTRTHVHSTFHICWGAQAGFYHYYGIQKRLLSEKLFGLYSHKVQNRKVPLVRGFDDFFLAPHSRHTETPAAAIHNCDKITVLAESEEAGVFLAYSEDGKKVFVNGHPEYDRYTLDAEYKRDLNKGLPIHIPRNYYPNDDPTQKPSLQWRSHCNNLYTNWLDYYVYQQTPYEW